MKKKICNKDIFSCTTPPDNNYSTVNSDLIYICSWIPSCAKLFVNHNELWEDLVPPDDDDSTELVEEFFASVAALMSIQLRGMVINSLADFLRFFETHKVRFIVENIVFTCVFLLLNSPASYICYQIINLHTYRNIYIQ